MERRVVIRTDRIRATEDLIAEANAQHVLEIGAGDHSFRPRTATAVQWVTADIEPPCDVLCDFNREDLRLPLQEHSFDLVICTQVLEHLLWPQSLLRDIHRVLKPRGLLIVSVPNIMSLTYRVAWMIGHMPSCAASGNLPPELGSNAYRRSDGSLIGGHVIDFDAKRLERLLASVGFDVEARRSSGLIWRVSVPRWLVPPGLSSNLLWMARRNGSGS